MSKQRSIARHQQATLHTARQHRASSEVLVNVTRRVVAHTSGLSTIEHELNLNEIPIPERRYVAEVGWVDTHDETVCLMFGQRAVGSDRLRSLLLVNIFPEPAIQFIGRSAEFVRNLHLFLERNNIPVPKVPLPAQEPEQTVTLTANMMSVTQVMRAVEWNFFHLPPSGMRELQNPGQTQVAVDPVVRVDLTASILAAILEQLTTIVPRLTPLDDYALASVRSS